VQLDEFKKVDEIFNNEYTYFSSISKTWIKHTKDYVDMMVKRFNFDSKSLVIEIASNDGCLLKNFINYKIPVLGVEPTANTAEKAENSGVRTIVEFFSSDFAKFQLVEKKSTADLIIGNNVLAHVPDINDFVKGMKLALNEDGIITMEFPHLLNLVNDCQFDTIYHEHFSYLSLIAVKSIFEKQGLVIFDVEEIDTHGGSLRIFAKHEKNNTHPISLRVNDLIEKEINEGLKTIQYYEDFQAGVDKIKYDAISFLIEQKRKGKKIIGYGAASKGNTLINYCGIKGVDLINFVVDASPYKQNKYLPGSHIPVLDESLVRKIKPDYIIILPWNLKIEISNQLDYIRDWGGKFVTYIPELNVF
jgi:SAM-dependent methyltransferase